MCGGRLGIEGDDLFITRQSSTIIYNIAPTSVPYAHIFNIQTLNVPRVGIFSSSWNSTVSLVWHSSPSRTLEINSSHGAVGNHKFCLLITCMT